MESQLANIPIQESTEYLIYMNDDFYVTQPMTPSDFASPLYGPVYRLAGDHWVVGSSDLDFLDKYNAETRTRVSHFTVGLISACLRVTTVDAEIRRSALLNDAKLAFPLQVTASESEIETGSRMLRIRRQFRSCKRPP